MSAWVWGGRVYYNRFGLRHMLVILYTRHGDDPFSKINKFASLTNCECY